MFSKLQQYLQPKSVNRDIRVDRLGETVAGATLHWPDVPVQHLDVSIARKHIPLRCFGNVIVSPVEDRRVSSVYWPNGRQQALIKGRRVKLRSYSSPTEPAPAPVAHVTNPAFWIGRLDRHFGHFTLEVAPRLVQAIEERPNDLYVFCAWPDDYRPDDTPSYFYQVIDWFGVPRDQVQIVAEPTEFAELRAGAQPEYMNGPGVCDAYLDSLDRVQRGHGVHAPNGPPVFVTRAEMPIAKGRLAGEVYLAKVLAEVGVRVIAPEKMSLRAQLEVYGTARWIIFSEGSALHGRQLLGRLAQNILVINRREASRLAQPGLLARCDHLAYYDGVLGDIYTLNPGTGDRNTSTTLSICAPKGLREMFAAFGLNLSGVWSDDAFVAARDADVLAYAEAQRKIYSKIPVEDHAQLDTIFRSSLEDAGLGGLWPQVAPKLARASEIGRINRDRRLGQGRGSNTAV